MASPPSPERIAAALNLAAGRAKAKTLYWSALPAMAQTIALSIDLLTEAERRPSRGFPRPAATDGAREPAAWATGLRSKLGVDDLAPLFHLPRMLAESAATFVFPIPLPELESAGALVDGKAFIFVSPNLGFRALSACAQHYFSLAHRAAPPTGEAVSFASEGQSATPSRRFARLAAADLLIPPRALAIAARRVRQLLHVKRAELGDLELLLLARIFGVEFSTVALQCERSGLLPRGGAPAMERLLSDSFGGPEQRASQAGLPERPALDIPIAPLPLLAIIAREISIGPLTLNLAAAGLSCSRTALAETLMSVHLVP